MTTILITQIWCYHHFNLEHLEISICDYNHSNIVLPPFITSKFSQGQENIQLIYTLGIMLNSEMTILVSLRLRNFLNDSIDGSLLTNKMILELARVSTIPNSIKSINNSTLNNQFALEGQALSQVIIILRVEFKVVKLASIHKLE